MKKLIFLFVAACLMAACTTAKPGYTITGSIDSIARNGDTVFLVKILAGQEINFDSTLITDGKFFFEGVADSTEYIKLKCPAISDFGFGFFLENGNINISCKAAKDEWTASGTPCNDAETAWRNEVMSVAEELLDFVGETDADEMSKENRRALDSIQEKMFQLNLKHLEKNIDNPVGLRQLKAGGWYLYTKKPQETTALLERLPAQYAADSVIVNLKKTIERCNKTSVGKKFVDFEMQTPEGKSVKLSDFVDDGKVVLVDFWASWCVPCRVSIPELKEIYAEYHPLGLEVLGVSLDEDAEAWKKAIKEEGLKWTQISDLKGSNCVAGKIYAINSIPAFMLIDSEGTIISRDRDIAKIREKLDELLK